MSERRHIQCDMTCVEPPFDPVVAATLELDPPWLTFSASDPTKLVLLLPGFDANDNDRVAHWELPFVMLIDSALEDSFPPNNEVDRKYLEQLRDMLRAQADRIDTVLT
jgi:hypothetical protein